MKKIKIFFTFLFVINSFFVFCQKPSDIKYISFKFSHSRRIPYSEVSVEINRNQNNATVNVRSKAADNNKKWYYSKVNKDFIIDLKTFQRLSEKLSVLNTVQLDNKTGKDGTDCVIIFGNGDKSFNFDVWTPTYDTDKRNLKHFLDCCKELLIIGKLNPEDIL